MCVRGGGGEARDLPFNRRRIGRIPRATLRAGDNLVAHVTLGSRPVNCQRFGSSRDRHWGGRKADNSVAQGMRSSVCRPTSCGVLPYRRGMCRVLWPTGYCSEPIFCVGPGTRETVWDTTFFLLRIISDLRGSIPYLVLDNRFQ